jgi:hypothetical protein
MVALTEIEVAEMALDRLRQPNDLPSTAEVVSDLTGATLAEELLLRWYTQSVAELFELMPWQPMTVWAALELLVTSDGTEAWAGKWTYQFAYPELCSSLREVFVPGDSRRVLTAREYAVSSAVIEGGDEALVIYADCDTLNAEYIAEPTSPDVYGQKALICKAISLQLALNMCTGFGIGDATKREIERDFTIALGRADRVDANESEPGPRPMSSIAAARFGS